MVPGAAPDRQREGIVEQFRVARVVGLPATIAIPTFTATITPTKTETPIPSVTATPTETGTATLTMTPTATLDCSLITTSSPTLLDGGGNGYFYFQVHNGTGRVINLTGGSLSWDKFYGGQNFYGAWFSYWYLWGPADPTPPSNVSPGASIALAAGASQWWYGYFIGTGGPLYGDFSTSLTFDSVCNVSASI